ncbi:hypothetical protein [Modicisalibacter radicis]|uniref:hypothetical protein n=1 Tax=Halomonas sp. EAR18 TaxID=2518972 RepID=UPI0014440557|nr:hypothetical protein [Halomonas sp. EAR18]
MPKQIALALSIMLLPTMAFADDCQMMNKGVTTCEYAQQLFDQEAGDLPKMIGPGIQAQDMDVEGATMKMTARFPITKKMLEQKMAGQGEGAEEKFARLLGSAACMEPETEDFISSGGKLEYTTLYQDETPMGSFTVDHCP